MMNNNNSNGVNWDETTWQEINDAVVKEVAKVRVAQKVFPTIALDSNPTEIPNDVITFADDGPSIQEGRTKSLIEIYLEFSLTATQVNREPQIKTCKTLARMAAKAIALTEDTIILQGNNGPLPANVQADLRESANGGLLGEARPERPCQGSRRLCNRHVYRRRHLRERFVMLRRPCASPRCPDTSRCASRQRHAPRESRPPPPPSGRS